MFPRTSNLFEKCAIEPIQDLQFKSLYHHQLPAMTILVVDFSSTWPSHPRPTGPRRKRDPTFDAAVFGQRKVFRLFVMQHDFSRRTLDLGHGPHVTWKCVKISRSTTIHNLANQVEIWLVPVRTLHSLGVVKLQLWAMQSKVKMGWRNISSLKTATKTSRLCQMLHKFQLEGGRISESFHGEQLENVGKLDMVSRWGVFNGLPSHQPMALPQWLPIIQVTVWRLETPWRLPVPSHQLRSWNTRKNERLPQGVGDVHMLCVRWKILQAFLSVNATNHKTI